MCVGGRCVPKSSDFGSLWTPSASDKNHVLWLTGNSASSPIGRYSDFKLVGRNGYFVYNPHVHESAAHFWGFVENYADPKNNILASGSNYKRWKFDFVFRGRRSNRPNGSPVGRPKANWRYYDMISGRLEVVAGTNAGQVFEVRQHSHAWQVGTGANAKDGDFGAASWFQWRVPGGAWHHGDVNIDLSACQQTTVRTGSILPGLESLTNLFSWQPTSWRTCTASVPGSRCGTGVQHRDALCIDLFGNVDGSKCLPTLLPLLSEDCSLGECTADTSRYKLTSSAWSPCSAPCGGGVSTRTLSCHDTQSGSTVSMSTCEAIYSREALLSSQECHTHRCATPTFDVGEWSLLSDLLGVSAQVLEGRQSFTRHFTSVVTVVGSP